MRPEARGVPGRGGTGKRLARRPKLVERLAADLELSGYDESHREFFRKFEAEGIQSPLAELPALVPWLEEVYGLYWQLNTERPLTDSGGGPIPWSKREDRLDREGITDPDLRREILELWQLMENKHLAWQAERVREAMRGTGTK